MTTDEITKAIAELPKGANIYATWERPCKVRAAFRGVSLTKRTRSLVRVGVEYDNTTATQEARESGEAPSTNAGVRGFEWVAYPLTLRAIRSGKLYVRFETGTFSGNGETTYLLDGKPVELAEVEHMLLASETKPKNGGFHCFNVALDSLLAIHRTATA